MHTKITSYTKSTIATVLLFISTESIFAKNMNNLHYNNQDITFDTRISIGVQSMVANEYVYQPYDVKKYGFNKGHKNSQLIWDTDSLAMVGLGGSLHFQEKYTLNLDYWFSVNKSKTKMTDYDWMIPNYDWTHRSISKNTDVSSASIFDISAEFNDYALYKTTISPLVGYRQDSTQRKAYGGTFIYSVEKFRDYIGSLPNNQLMISYKQTWKSPYLGLKTNTHITNLLTLHTKFIYAPVIKGEVKDIHHLRDIVGTSSLSKTNMYAIDLGLSYQLNNALGIRLNYMYQKFSHTKGNLKWVERGVTQYFPNTAGADLKTSLFSLSLDYKF